ncbi:MAG: hypothetical protein II295_09175 [Akkermansia sp.]|nr:hypothetical protein [Akkermansia sp.]
MCENFADMARSRSSSLESNISAALATLSIALATAVLFPSCQRAPMPHYAQTEQIVQRRSILAGQLENLLPAEQRALPAAQEEARWLADTAYKASVSIARLNKPLLWPAWMNNRLVNAPFNIRERGLCWHYQHDLYRELRRRKLQYFALGCCVRDKGEGSEHNCVYVTARNGSWPQAVTLDPWRKNGRLVAYTQQELADENWEPSPHTADTLALIYPECHTYPVEHWAMVKTGKKWNDYAPTWLDSGRYTRQGKIMYNNMYNALKTRGGKLTDY